MWICQAIAVNATMAFFRIVGGGVPDAPAVVGTVTH